MQQFEYMGFLVEPACIFDEAKQKWQVIVAVRKAGADGVVYFRPPEFYKKEPTAISAAIRHGKMQIDRERLRGDGGLGDF